MISNQSAARSAFSVNRILFLLFVAFALAAPCHIAAQTDSAAAPTTPSLERAPAPLSHLQYVYHHFYYNYNSLRLLPQYYEDIFSYHGRLPAKRWLDFYDEQLRVHEGAFFHLYELVNEPDYSLNDFISTSPLYGQAVRDATLVDFGAERAQVYGRLGLMFGDIYLARGDQAKAFECYGLIVKMTRLEPQSPLLLHLISLQLRQLAYNHLAMAMDPFAGAPAGTLSPGLRDVLREFLNELTAYRPIEEQHDMEGLLLGEARDLWETLDFYDPPAQPLPQGGARDVWKAVLDRWQPVWESGRAPDEIQVVSGRRRFATLQGLQQEVRRLEDDRLFVRDFSAATRRDVLYTRITLTQTFWKLLYLETLAILDPKATGSFSALKNAIPPDFYPHMLLDPFTGLMFGSMANQPGARSHYYSFGPDRDDDAGATLYNPERGLISDGDIPLFY